MLEWFSHIGWWISQYVSFESSQSRWGMFALLFAISIFLLEGSGMIQRWAERHKIASKTFFVVGCFFVALTLFVGVFWLVGGSKDTTPSDIQGIKSKLESVEDRLGNIEKAIEELTNEQKSGEPSK